MTIVKHITYILLVTLFVFLALRGVSGNPTPDVLNTPIWKENGPFELSPERGRFALVYSLVEDKSLYFSLPLARFVTPDLGFSNGHYVSLFAPGVSLLTVPGYIIGNFFGASQVGTVSVIALFAVFNALLIEQLSKNIGADAISSKIAGLTFLFATPAFAYAVSLYQHHISTCLILLSVLMLVKYNKSWISLALIWFLCGLAVIVDYPNFFLMFPIGLVALAKAVSFKQNTKKYLVNLSFSKMLATVGLIIPVVILLIFNYFSYGNPLTLSGTVASVQSIEEDVLRDENTQDVTILSGDSVTTFFDSRKLINGLYIHFFSPDRGTVVFAPILIFSLIGIVLLYKREQSIMPLLLGVLMINIILYGMWSDPWGGWAFGSRYLIPGYAILAIFSSVALSKYKKHVPYLFAFSIILIASYSINTLGALTTSANPPQIQIASLEEISGRKERFSVDRNWEYLNNSGTKSLVYNNYISKYLDPKTYYILIVSAISCLALGQMFLLYSKKTH